MLRRGEGELSASNRTILQSVLAADYDHIVRRLARRFGSADFARETLHETFLRLNGISDHAEVRSPRDYLFRAAINIGKNLRRNDRVDVHGRCRTASGHGDYTGGYVCRTCRAGRRRC